MSGTFVVTMGDRGRVVIPQELRERLGLHAGTPLSLVETVSGLMLLTRDQLKDVVRRDLADADLVSLLLEDRRAEAARDALATGPGVLTTAGPSETA